MEVLNFRGRSESFHFQGGGVCLFGGEVVSSGVHGQFKKQDYIVYIFIYVLVLFIFWATDTDTEISYFLSCLMSYDYLLLHGRDRGMHFQSDQYSPHCKSTKPFRIS